jgi:hypothetical protein
VFDEGVGHGGGALGVTEFELAGKMGMKNESKNEEFCKIGGGGPFCKKWSFLASFTDVI